MGADMREKFFEECLLRKRRERQVFRDAPVAKIFIDQERWAELRPRSLIESVKRALADQFLDHKRLEKRIAREKKKANERGAETEQEFLERQLAGLKRVKATEEQMKQNP